MVRDSEQEDDPEQNRDAADPGEDATAEDLLEAALWGGRSGPRRFRLRWVLPHGGQRMRAGGAWLRGGGREDPALHPLEPARQIRQPLFV
jgi:hypothetical protein